MSYTKLNEAGKHYKHFQILHILLIRCDAKLPHHYMMQDANKHMDDIFKFYAFF
jgi:hypothetical protein